MNKQIIKILENNEKMEENMVIKKQIGWKQLEQYNNNPPKISFPKGLTVYNKYKIFRETIKIPLFDYLMKRLFNNNTIFFKIITADFPYYVSEYITHKIIWFNPNYYNNINIDYNFVNKILKKKYKKYIVFENNFENKSVKTIKHFHFFIIDKETYLLSNIL